MKDRASAPVMQAKNVQPQRPIRPRSAARWMRHSNVALRAGRGPLPRRLEMFFHRKELIVPVEVKNPDPAYAQFLLQQFGGATGELTAALQYWVQSFHCDNIGIRDLLQDISLEEFSHLEVVGKLIEQHTKGVDKVESDAHRSPLFALRRSAPHFVDDSGVSWTASYINEGGDVVRDLRADIAAEGGARETYEALLKHAKDAGTKQALHHLLTREISH